MDIPLLISSINGAVNLGGVLLDERDRQKLATIQIDLSKKLTEAQIQVSQVLAAIIEKDGLIRTLTERNRELEANQSERGRYKLAKLGVLGDFFAYRLREMAELSERQDEPVHFLCQTCFDGGKKSVLRLTEFTASCNLCNKQTQIKTRPPINYRGVGSGWQS